MLTFDFKIHSNINLNNKITKISKLHSFLFLSSNTGKIALPHTSLDLVQNLLCNPLWTPLLYTKPKFIA